MPFTSKAQMKAAFAGYLGKEMKGKAHQWAQETPDVKSLPEHKKYTDAAITHARGLVK